MLSYGVLVVTGMDAKTACRPVRILDIHPDFRISMLYVHLLVLVYEVCCQ